MAAFLLWNTGKRHLDELVRNLVAQHEIDVVLLVEYAFGESGLPRQLMLDGLVKRNSGKRFGIFTRQGHSLLRLRYPLGKRAGLWKWTAPSGQDGLIALLHGLDRRNYDDSTRRVFFRRVVDAVERREHRQRHKRTLIAGDFNAHPFESAIVDSDGLHAIGVRKVRFGTNRSVRGAANATDFFYNPMWRMYGHQPHLDAGAGTHYWIGAWAHELAWHMTDQIVLRPGESPSFPESELKVITQVKDIPLLDDQNLPNKQSYSDHLPIVFHWNL